MADEEPDYKVYRSRPRFLSRGRQDDGLAELRDAPSARDAPPGSEATPGAAPPGRDGARPGAAPPGDARDPGVEIHRSRRGPRLPTLPRRKPRLPGAPRPRITLGRVVKWLVLALVAWVGLSAILFMVSAQIQRGDLHDKVAGQLSPGPY